MSYTALYRKFRPQEFEDVMREHEVPEWYIASCKKIKYIACCKQYYPLLLLERKKKIHKYSCCNKQ